MAKIISKALGTIFFFVSMWYFSSYEVRIIAFESSTQVSKAIFTFIKLENFYAIYTKVLYTIHYTL